ncbi:MAG: glycosyl transferase family protein [Candidatus Peregrinibacteria bacterium Greene0416_19]|nr:MAG: glycosyl transferase family protein [Candidatus Peregrinibacteria bacterium Greene0416_19]
MPTVSVLIPTYEPRPDHLHAALDGLRAQTFGEWHAFIHDDASTMDVRSLLEPYLGDPRITFNRSERRLGIGGNWNACLKRATGTYMQFLFQDDLWEPTYLEKCVEILEREPTVGFVAANHVYRYEDTVPNAGYDELQSLRRQLLIPGLQDRRAFLALWAERGLHPNLIGEPSFVMLRRSLTEEVGLFDESMPQGLDLEYWVRCLLHSDWSYLEERLGEFRVHPGGASARHQTQGMGLFDRVRCLDLVMGKAQDRSVRHAARRGMIHYLSRAAGRFLRHVSGGGGVGGATGMKQLLRLGGRHPLLMGRGLWRALVRHHS